MVSAEEARRAILIKQLEAHLAYPERIYTLRDRVAEARGFLVDLGGYNAAYLTLDVAEPSSCGVFWVVYHYANPDQETSDFEVDISASGMPIVLRFKKHLIRYPANWSLNPKTE